MAFSASALLLAGMMVVYEVPPTAALLWLPIVLAMNLALATGIAYPTALAGVWVRDLQPFAISLVRTMFFLAPGLVALETITGEANELVRINPLSGLFEAYRSVLMFGEAPQAWEILYPLVFALGLAAVFMPLYRREQAHFAKVLD
jgi:lipopolysaccharide transport system permease protein